MAKNFCYVDNSNVSIEGTCVSAVVKGLSPHIWARDADSRRICDFDWRLDFGRLFEFAAGPDVGRAVLYGSRPPEKDSIWAAARAKGFEVIIHEPNAQNREKKIDTQIATDMIEDSFVRMKTGDTITLVAGDSDYVPAIEKLRARGFSVEVCFWDQANSEIKRAADRFISLNKHLDHLNLNRK